MNVRASLRYLRMSPRKVRLVVDLIRGLDITKAERQLQFSRKWAARPVLKLLRSAIANAEHNHKLKRETLVIAKAVVNQGPTLKRYRPRAFGVAAPILKRSSHVLIELASKEAPKEVPSAKDKGQSTKSKVQSMKPEGRSPKSKVGRMKDKVQSTQ